MGLTYSCGHPTYKSGQIHDVVIGPLTPNTVYYYRFSSNSAHEFSFKTTTAKLPIKFALSEGMEWDGGVLQHPLYKLKPAGLSDLTRVYQDKLNNYGPVYINVGDGGNRKGLAKDCAKATRKVEEEEEEVKIDQRRLSTDYDPDTFDPTKQWSPLVERVFRLVDEIAGLTLMEMSELGTIIMRRMELTEPPTIRILKGGAAGLAGMAMKVPTATAKEEKKDEKTFLNSNWSPLKQLQRLR
ncbi:unnamed protein product [Dovyalis caffra]|uniref:Purple acid phosphatase N-terminal domain-containing protein n=1 Tax=Dovyalis caffra TaxID=77055 RepID=A0AAV1QRL6_9ROSI|nr:unnamed protein product [Dovyalis caffra]